MGRSPLEWGKFAVYLFVPIAAVLLYSLPSVHVRALTGSRYVVYPAEREGFRVVPARKEEAQDGRPPPSPPRAT